MHGVDSRGWRNDQDRIIYTAAKASAVIFRAAMTLTQTGQHALAGQIKAVNLKTVKVSGPRSGPELTGHGTDNPSL